MDWWSDVFMRRELFSFVIGVSIIDHNDNGESSVVGDESEERRPSGHL